MMQMVGRIIALVVLAVVVGIGGIRFDSGGTTTEVSSITDYRADFTVAANGELSAVETLTVSFPVPRHGIFRFFDTWDPNDAKNRLTPTDVRVTRDGSAEPFSMKTEQRGRYRTAKIGSADRTLTGEHTYRISYRIKGVLTSGESSRTQFYWNLIPPGWQMPIAASTLKVHLPAAAENLQCAVGSGAAQRSCQVAGSGTDTLTVTTGALGPQTPVTIQAGLEVPTPATDTLPWDNRLDPILGRSPVLLGLALLAALLLAGIGAALSLNTREKQPGFPLMYAPPDGVGPAQAAYILTEDVKEKQAFVATMMYAAEQGLVELNQDGKTWKMAGKADAEAWAKVDGVTHQAALSLGVASPGASFAASPKSVSAGKLLKSALSEFESNTKGWARTSGLLELSGLGGGGLFVLIVSFALTVFLGAYNPLNMSILALIPGLFMITALSVGATGAGTKRTAAGRDLWSRVGGFHRILSTPSAQDRFDFSGRKELYTAYLPWAVVFDCADEWAKKYRIETGEEPPVPSYLPYYAGAHTMNAVSQMVDSFDSAVSSAISSYQATQSSSSGGGGFSGGGGGGGGGGGSW